MILTMERVNQDLKDSGKSQFDLKIGVGLGTGYCVVGNMDLIKGLIILFLVMLLIFHQGLKVKLKHME